MTLTNIEPMWEQIIAPEIARRQIDVSSLETIFVEFFATGGHRVMFNDETDLEVFTDDASLVGNQLTQENWGAVQRVAPAQVDPTSAWIALLVVDGGLIGNFDMRRNLDRAREMVRRAREFYLSARDDLAAGRIGPAADAAWAAAELAVTADALIENKLLRGHKPRNEHLRFEATHDPRLLPLSETLTALYEMREATRYCDQPIPVRTEDLAQRLDDVDTLLIHVGRQILS